MSADLIGLLSQIVDNQGVPVMLVIVQTSNEQLAGELKHTIATMRQYYEQCAEERRELYRKLGERAARE